MIIVAFTNIVEKWAYNGRWWNFWSWSCADGTGVWRKSRCSNKPLGVHPACSDVVEHHSQVPKSVCTVYRVQLLEARQLHPKTCSWIPTFVKEVAQNDFWPRTCGAGDWTLYKAKMDLGTCEWCFTTSEQSAYTPRACSWTRIFSTPQRHLHRTSSRTSTIFHDTLIFLKSTIIIRYQSPFIRGTSSNPV